jgi:hypothetical protein
MKIKIVDELLLHHEVMKEYTLELDNKKIIIQVNETDLIGSGVVESSWMLLKGELTEEEDDEIDDWVRNFNYKTEV